MGVGVCLCVVVIVVVVVVVLVVVVVVVVAVVVVVVVGVFVLRSFAFLHMQMNSFFVHPPNGSHGRFHIKNAMMFCLQYQFNRQTKFTCPDPSLPT